MNINWFLIILVSCCLVLPSNGQEENNAQTSSFFDVIPSNSRIGLAWPQVTRLGPKVNDLSQQVYPGSGQMILSYARNFFTDAGINYNDPDFTKIIDRKRPGAYFGTKVETAYEPISVLPVGDLQKTADMLDIELDKLKSGKIYKSKSRNYVKYSRGYLYSSRQLDALADAEVDSPIGKQLTEFQRKQFSDADALLFLDDELAGDVLGGFFESFGDLSWLTTGGEEESSDEFTELATNSASEFAFGLAGIELDRGFGVNYTSFFKEDQNNVQKLVESIRGGDGASNLDHLPNDNFVAAFAARGTGKKNVLAAKAFLKAIVNRISPGEEILTSKDKPVFYNSFARVWQQLNGTRVGVYRVEHAPATDGNLVAITIFDVDEPQRLLDQLPELVKFANQSAERNSANEDLLPIRFKYVPGAEKIDNYSVDVLEIDTDRLDEKTKIRFRLLFGEHAKQLRFVPLKKHVLMIIGTHSKLLTQTIENLKTNEKGLSEHPAIVMSNKRIDSRRKLEAHFSFQNLLDIYSFDEQLLPFQQFEQVTSLGLTIEPERIGFDSWFPAKEIDAAIDWSLLWY